MFILIIIIILKKSCCIYVAHTDKNHDETMPSLHAV